MCVPINRFSSSAVVSRLTCTSATIEEELSLFLNGRMAKTEGIYDRHRILVLVQWRMVLVIWDHLIDGQCMKE